MYETTVNLTSSNKTFLWFARDEQSNSICGRSSFSKPQHLHVAKLDVVKHSLAVILLTAKQRDVQSDCREPWFVLTSLTSRSSMLV